VPGSGNGTLGRGYMQVNMNVNVAESESESESGRLLFLIIRSPTERARGVKSPMLFLSSFLHDQQLEYTEYQQADSRHLALIHITQLQPIPSSLSWTKRELRVADSNVHNVVRQRVQERRPATDEPSLESFFVGSSF